MPLLIWYSYNLFLLCRGESATMLKTLYVFGAGAGGQLPFESSLESWYCLAFSNYCTITYSISRPVLYVGGWARGPCVVCSSTLTLQACIILAHEVDQAVGRALGPGLGCSSAFIGCSCLERVPALNLAPHWCLHRPMQRTLARHCAPFQGPLEGCYRYQPSFSCPFFT